MSKKNEVTVETVAEEAVAPKFKKRKTKIWFLVVIAAVAVLGYKLWENPKLLNQFRDMLANKQVEEDVYLVQINELQKQLAMLKSEVAEVAQTAANPDLSEVYQKLENTLFDIGFTQLCHSYLSIILGGVSDSSNGIPRSSSCLNRS